MAPMMIDSDAHDDFVRTISDDEPLLQNENEELDPALEDSTPKTLQGKKRKREIKDGNVDTNKKVKKNRQSKEKIVKSTKNGMEELDDEVETWTAQGEDDGALDSDFEFQIGDSGTGVTEDFDGWGLNAVAAQAHGQGGGNKRGVDIDELIARRTRKEVAGDKNIDELSPDTELRSNGSGEEDDSVADDDAELEEDETLAEDAFGMGAPSEDEEESAEEKNDDQDPNDSSDEEAIADPMPDLEYKEDDASSEEDAEERVRREAFFAPEDPASKAGDKSSTTGSFQTMSLSRPILRGLAAVGFTNPTPIQNKTIPVALLAKDVVGGAVTGSGKTAAFIIPILERLLYRPKKVPTSRVAILMPTRELAVQCFNVAKKLASFTDVTFCQLVGGFSLREQENVLRSRPDVIIATPGRFIDHMRNSASFTVDTLEILVLDEADRMLEDGFADELNEILTTIPKSRQTMLFSATMTESVDKLIRVGLNRPVRLMVDAKKQTVGTLVQEFVRLRPGREEKRMGYLLYLCKEVFTESVIVFFRQKKEAHRARIIFGLCGIKAGELHGSMTQEQRISALTNFRTSQTTHLLATDLASRGLDIKNVSTVLNYSPPQNHSIYLHRVGRTARAGRAGRACTIASEPDRKLIREIVRSARAQGAKIVSRVVDNKIADLFAGKVDGLAGEVEDILREEKEERGMQEVEMRVRKGENALEHAEEIGARPKRTWFEGEREKEQARERGRVELNGPGGGAGGKAKLSNKTKKKLDDGRERVEGRVWKKGKGERGGKGAGGKQGGKTKVKVKVRGKPKGKPKGRSS